MEKKSDVANLALIMSLGLALLLPNAIDLLQALVHPGISDALTNTDFANYWTASRLATTGAALDLFAGHDVYFAHMRRLFGEDYPWHSWSYPPHFVLFLLPLGFFDYKVAFLAFQGATFLVFLFAARLFVPSMRRHEMVLLLPFIFVNFWAGQNGFLTAAFMLGALALRYDRPVLAGILLGCLTIKPQLGLLFPLLLLIEGRWRVIFSAALTTVLLVAFSLVLFGAEAWHGFLSNTSPYQLRVAMEGTGIFLAMMPSLFGSLRNLGFSGEPAIASHVILVGIPVLAVFVLAVMRPSSSASRSVLLVVATMAITPYSLFYDLGAYSVALLLVIRQLDLRNDSPSISAITCLSLLMVSLPLLMLPFGSIGLPVAPALILATLFWTLSDPWGSTASAHPPQRQIDPPAVPQ